MNMQQALARSAAREKRNADHIARNDAIISDLLRGKEPVRVAASHGVPLHAVLRLKGTLG